MGFDYEKRDAEIGQVKKNYRIDSEKIKEIDKKHFDQLYKAKKKTDSEIYNENFCFNNCHMNSEHKEFDKKAYTSCSFDKCKFGVIAVINEANMYRTGASFWNVTFTNCIFENIYFSNSRFMNCKFTKCVFMGYAVVFDNCTFQNMKLPIGSTDILYSSTEFVECNISSVRFRDCDAANLILDNNNFILSTFSECNLEGALFDGNAFYSTVFRNSNLRNVCVINLKKADIEFYFTAQEKDTNLFKNIYISNRYSSKKLCKEDYKDLAKMYYTLLEYLQKRNLNDEYISNYRYLYNYYSMRAKPWLKGIWEWLSWMSCGFGEKVGRFFCLFLAAILLPAIGYLFTGIHNGSKVIQFTKGESFEKVLSDIFSCLHFSIVTLSTVGYGNIVPFGTWSYIISMMQIMSSIFIVAMATSIILKKMLRQ